MSGTGVLRPAVVVAASATRCNRRAAPVPIVQSTTFAPTPGCYGAPLFGPGGWATYRVSRTLQTITYKAKIASLEAALRYVQRSRKCAANFVVLTSAEAGGGRWRFAIYGGTKPCPHRWARWVSSAPLLDPNPARRGARRRRPAPTPRGKARRDHRQPGAGGSTTRSSLRRPTCRVRAPSPRINTFPRLSTNPSSGCADRPTHHQ